MEDSKNAKPTPRNFATGAVSVLCFVAGITVVPILALAYLDFGKPPVSVTDPAFPMEAAIVHTPLAKRIDHEMPVSHPDASTPQDLIAGAAVYKRECAFCHGLPQKPSAIGKHMYPSVPQLWQTHRNDVVGVSDDPVGETYWKVKNGIRLTGMPAYSALLSEQEMWQVSFLLSTANKPLPAEAQTQLTAQ
ncbi:mono/diheme cytochrome c family protein [Granulicella aggregans]|jgi:thiosulfate dehydrogenase|uniref:Mono/diheme cytochrome c family protein n=1 Tax=Granulicella aggregans TaxID=474949 RepID=A0A7W7ZGI2_9BACT|nr:cytochrome c [Granulicella aggregans]MBB5059438.1 mono/diheme cytochrome c family protein [Granulicella aggregans]